MTATGANVLLLTFFLLQSFQSPFGRRHLAQLSKMMDMQRTVLMAAEEHFKLGNPSAESYFKPWIKQDLSLWAQDGISLVRLQGLSPNRLALHARRSVAHLAALTLQDQVDEMATRYKECLGEVFRFQILNSTLWVEHISERHKGWYPASSGPGTAHHCALYILLQGSSLCIQFASDMLPLSQLQVAFRAKARYLTPYWLSWTSFDIIQARYAAAHLVFCGCEHME